MEQHSEAWFLAQFGLRGGIRVSPLRSAQTFGLGVCFLFFCFPTALKLGSHMDVPTAVSRAVLIGPEVTEATFASFLTSERWAWACGNEIRRFVLNHIFCWCDSLALRLITEASLDHHLACCPLRDWSSILPVSQVLWAWASQ